MWLLLQDKIFDLYIDTNNRYSTIDKSMFQKLLVGHVIEHAIIFCDNEIRSR